MGGGMPVGAFGGRREILDLLAPEGPVYQAGTLSGNPVAMAAGVATLNELTKSGFYESLATKTKRLTSGIIQRAQAAKIPLSINQIGSMFGLFFTEQNPVQCIQYVMQRNLERFTTFFHEMLIRGIYFAPSAFEIGFVSIAHSEKDIELTLEAFEEVFALI